MGFPMVLAALKNRQGVGQLSHCGRSAEFCAGRPRSAFAPCRTWGSFSGWWYITWWFIPLSK